MIEKLKEILAEYSKDSAEYRVLSKAIKDFEEHLASQGTEKNDKQQY